MLLRRLALAIFECFRDDDADVVAMVPIDAIKRDLGNQLRIERQKRCRAETKVSELKVSNAVCKLV